MGEIAEQFREPLRLLESRGLTLLLESDPSVYTTNHQLLARLLDALDSPAAGAIFDPGNDIFDERGEVPYPDGYQGYCSLETHYRLGARISEELMRLPQGSGFSDGGMAATGESALALEQLLKEVG